MVMGAGSILIAVGGLLLIFGLFGSLFTEFKPHEGIHRGDTAIFSVALLRCMIAITVADNELEDREVVSVAKIYKHLTGSNIGERLIRDTAAQMMEEGVNIQKELSNTRDSIDRESKEKIILASLYILAADGVMDEGEELFLEDIREGLKVPMNRFSKIKNDFLKARTLKKKTKSK